MRDALVRANTYTPVCTDVRSLVVLASESRSGGEKTTVYSARTHALAQAAIREKGRRKFLFYRCSSSILLLD